MAARSMMLADAGASNDDASYTGDTGGSAFSWQYYVNKVNEFQSVMNALDLSAEAAGEMLGYTNDDQLIADLSAMLDEYDAKKYQFRVTAEAINAGGAAVNAVGGRFPELSIPSGLGIGPLVLGAGALAAIAVAAQLVIWGSQWMAGVTARMNVAAAAAQISDPDQRDQYLMTVAKAQAAQDAASESPLSSIANIVKWAAILFGGFFVFKAIGERT